MAAIFWQVKYSLKPGNAGLHRYPVGQTFGQIRSISHGFQVTSIFVFCNFFAIQNGCHFWLMKYMLKLGKASLHTYPVGQKFS